MPWPDPVTLRGPRAVLEPLSQSHAPDLARAVGDLHRLWYTSVPKADDMPAEIDRRLALQQRGEMLPFAIVDTRSGKAIGMTTYLNIEPTQRRVEIGATWQAKTAQRSGINTQAKLLMLTHAFEALDCIAVEFRTHFMNHQSRAAIEKLGAKLDGVLRSHRTMPDGALRDTAVYSIIASEWPAVRTNLTWQIEKHR